MNLKKFAKAYIEQKPTLWNYTWNLIQSTKFFLPHDPTYYALPYLSANLKNGLILDIGANSGISALSFRKLLPAFKVISFEPNRLLERYLNKLKNDDGNFSYMMVGLGSSYGEFPLYTPIYKNIPLHTFSSFHKSNIEKTLSISYSNNTLKDIKIVESICNIVTLDSLNLSPQLVKIDAEGHELDIFKGGANTLIANKPPIIFEACHGNFNEIYLFLDHLGYKIYSFLSADGTFKKYENGGLLLNSSGNRNLIAIHSQDAIHFSLPLSKE